MPRNKIIIFIVVFLVVGASIYGVYSFFSGPKTPADNTKDGTGGYQEFTPFGTGGTTTGTNTNTGVDNGEQTVDGRGESGFITQSSKLRKITTFSIAGASFLEDTRAIPQVEGVKPDPKKPLFETVPALKYVERATGHIYERYLDTDVEGKISNSTIPNIYESLFDGKGKTLVYRYLGEGGVIQSFMATLGAAKGEFLTPGMIDVSLSPDKTKMFYLTETSSGVLGTIQTFGDTKKNQLFSSPFSEWLSQWATSATIFLTTKASGQADGYVYSLSTAKGALKKVFGPIVGLTTLANQSGTTILYSASLGGSPSLGLLDVAKHTTRSLALSGLPEKCAWSKDNITLYCAIPNTIPSSIYPDVWYKGIISFTDRFMKINTQTLEKTPLDGGEFDATHVFLDNTETKLFFTNKKDSTLWSLDLKN
jgi:hypothetical protein